MDITKRVQNKFKNRVKIILPSRSTTTYNNVYEHGQTFVVHSKISTLFFFSTDLKVESSILNFKLATLQKKTLLTLFTLGRINQNSSTLFCGLSLNSIIKSYEAKAADFSKAVNPVFLYGRSFIQRGNFFSCTGLLKQKVKSLAVITTTIFSNEVGITFLNLPRASIKLKSSIVFCLNTKDSLSLRKIIRLLSRRVFWFNSVIIANFNTFLLIPTAPHLSETGLYLSHRLSVAKKVLISVTKSKPITTLLSAIFQISGPKNKSLQMLLTELESENYCKTRVLILAS